MVKQRILALIVLVISFALGYYIYWSEITDKNSFKLGLDLSGGTYLVYQADIANISPEEIENSMNALRDVIERRVNLFGISEPRVSTETTTLSGQGKEYRLVVELPGVADAQEAIALIGQTPLLEFKIENPNPESINLKASDVVDGTIDLSPVIINDRRYITTALTGQYLSRSTLQFDPTTNAPVIALQFNEQGAALFESITEQNIGKTVAIYLDGAIISAPVVNQKITGGEAIITGSFTANEAKVLVGRLNSGALPVPINLISTETIGPSLGSNAIAAGITAGLIGIIAISSLLIIWYRVPGIIAVVSLIVYTILTLLSLKLIPVTLTAAGIAGFVISLGMAVDANILIFERMKEELHGKRSIIEAVRIGFDRAWTSIRDGNSASLLSAIILFWFGTPMIQGFALTFGIGVFISMISAISVSKIMLISIAGNTHSRIARFLFSSGFTK